MDTICFLQLPDNFEELYSKYRERLLGDESKETVSEEAGEFPVSDHARPSKIDQGAEMKGNEEQESATAIFDVPQGTTWHELIVKFKDEQTIEVYKGTKYLGVADFKSMGFGSKKPDQRWEFLHRLAIIYETNPSKNPGDMPATIDHLSLSLLKGNNEANRRHIQTLRTQLSHQLEKDFGINDPFEDYDQWHYYKTKFKLKPEPDMRQEEPYEADKQLHEGIERIGSDDPNFEKLKGPRLSDEDNADEFEPEDDGGSVPSEDEEN